MSMKAKRFLSLILCVLLILTLLPVTVLAAVNDTFTYDGIKYKVLTETGDTGTVKIDSNNNTSLLSADIPQTVENGGISYTVTAVGGSAFFLCSSLASVTLPDTITEIAVSAFWVCSSLTSIDIPDGVTKIGTSAFRQTGLTSVVIPDGVKVIEMHTFRSCSSLASVTIPASVTTIKSDAFTDSPGVTIYGYSGSYAQTYAVANGIPFVTLSVDPTIDPSIASFDKRPAVQSDVSTVITWNAASSVTDITADGTSIGTDNYSVAGIDADSAMLTIKKEYLAEREAESFDLIIAFDAGNPVTMTIEISDSRPRDATLRDLTVGGFTISGFAADTDVYSAVVPCGTRAGSDDATVGASAANEDAVITITQAPYLPGSATVLVISGDGSVTKTYTVNFTVNGPPGDTRDLLTSPADGVVKYIYFGNYDGSPLKWRVLGKNTNEVFILSNEAVTSSVFSLEWDNHYSTSYVRSWLTEQFQSGAFSAQELAAIRPQRVVDIEGLGVSTSEYDLAGDRVFLLSGNEAVNSDYFTGTSPGYGRELGAGHWWLRSAGAYPILALFIQADGIFTTSGAGVADNILCVRPGCKIALSSILLVTAATDGKPAAVGSSLTAMGAPTGDMKLTILEDSILALNSSVSRKTTMPGSVITIPYTGAETGAGHYVSCAIVDSEGEITHYGKLVDLTAASGDGSAEISIPSDTPAGEYTLLLFNERIMGDYETDYASTPAAIDFKIKNSITGATVSPQTGAIDLYHPDHVQATITWNDAACVSAVTAGGNPLTPDTDFIVTDKDADTAMLTIKKEYLMTQETGDLTLTVEFDTGETATLTISITDTTPPAISPVSRDYNLNAPADVTTTIFWNSASSVDDVVYRVRPDADVHTLDMGDYSVAGSTFTILDSFLSGLSLTTGAALDFDISFDTGATAALTVNIVDSYVPSDNADLSSLSVNGTPMSGFAPDVTAYNVELPYGASSATVTATTSDPNAGYTVTPASTLPVPGSATVTVTAENGACKTYTIDFTIGAAPIVAVTNITVTGTGGVSGIQAGNSLQMLADISPANATDRNVTWSVAAGSGATINASGLLTATAEGSVTVRATANDGSGVYGEKVITVTAATVTTYTVTFNSNGSVYATKTVNAGASIGSAAWPADPTRNSYIFGGWFTGENGTGTQLTSATPVNATTTVYAKWTYSGGGSIPAAPTTQSYYAIVTENKVQVETLPVTVVSGSTTGMVNVTEAKAVEFLAAGSNTAILVPSVPGVSSYNLEIPAKSLAAAQPANSLTFDTPSGSISIPGNMLSSLTGTEDKKAAIAIGQGDKASLTSEEKAAIGDRPLMQLTLTLNGTQTEWNNPSAPVTVTIPYKPTAEELKNPESLIIWYLDGSGKLVCIPNGHYDEATGTVTFRATHFSKYAGGYNPVSFKDVADGAWYKKAVSFIAARSITLGTGKGNYSPDAKLTRGEFIVLMMRAYEIAPDTNPTDNFADAGNTWYTGYLAAAKRLGISTGTGGNMYAPGREITRQEMFTLLYNALKVIGQLPGTHGRAVSEADDQPRGNSGKTLSDFTDAWQINSWAKEAMTQLVKTGIVGGNNGALTPLSTTTRAEIAQVLYNLLGK